MHNRHISLVVAPAAVVLLVAAAIAAVMLWNAPSGEATPCVPDENPPDVTGDEVTLASGLVYIDFAPGTGEVAQTGDTVAVDHTGWVQDTGPMIATSICSSPFLFEIGAGSVIEGWEQGLPGLAVGGQRRLIIPPDLAYGDVGSGGAPPNATLIFDIELLDILTPTPTPVGQTPSPTPTEAPGDNRIWGDHNCFGGANPVDSLLTLRFDAGLSANTGDCPDLGQVVDVQNASPHPWGDVDCGGDVTPVDSLKLLRFDAGLSVSQEANCPEIGASVTVLGG